MEKDTKIIFEFPIFSRWASDEIMSYAVTPTHPHNKNLPFRKGVPRGQKPPISPTKHSAAVLSVGYGKELKSATLGDLQELIPAVSLPVLQNWRKEKSFKQLVDGLKQKFAAHIAHYIFYGGPELLPFFEFDLTQSELRLKIFHIREALAYPPDLVDTITSYLVKYVNTVETRTVGVYLGYHIFCIRLLQVASDATPKSREGKIYSTICKNILGQHCEDHFLIDYLTENASPTKGLSTHLKWARHFEDCQTHAEAYLKNGDYVSLQNEYKEEMAGMLNSEISKLQKGENVVDLEDIKRGVNFLAGIYKFKKTELESDEEAVFIL